jgi:DegV family protein with EDD domain
MPSIAIVTDTDSSLPLAIAARHRIHQAPMTVHFGSEVLETGIDIDDAGLFARIDREGKLPTTASPSPGKFAAAFGAAFDDGADAVICFTASSKVSAGYNAAQSACDEFPGRDIRVVDTLSLSMGEGFMVLAAAEAAEAGAPIEEAIARALDVRERTHLYASLSTLKYLAMSGRVGQMAAGMATLLNVKPIVTIRGGTLDMLERVRTQSKAWARVVELAQLAAGERPVERMAMLHANALAEARQMEQQLRAVLRCPPEIITAELTPGMSVHAGAGLVGVALVVS